MRARRPNPVSGSEYGAVLSVLVAWRRGAGISQRELARRIRRSNSHVSMIENGQRRLELLEFYEIARALGVSPASLFAEVAERLENLCAPGGPCESVPP